MLSYVYIVANLEGCHHLVYGPTPHGPIEEGSGAKTLVKTTEKLWTARIVIFALYRLPDGVVHNCEIAFRKCKREQIIIIKNTKVFKIGIFCTIRLQSVNWIQIFIIYRYTDKSRGAFNNVKHLRMWTLSSTRNIGTERYTNYFHTFGRPPLLVCANSADCHCPVSHND